jgi:hypothetical protein
MNCGSLCLVLCTVARLGGQFAGRATPLSAHVVRLHSHQDIVQGLPRVLCSFDSRCRHLGCRSGSILDIVRALGPPELLVGEDDSESCEGQTENSDDQAGDPVLDLDRGHGDGVGIAAQGREMGERNSGWVGSLRFGLMA